MVTKNNDLDRLTYPITGPNRWYDPTVGTWIGEDPTEFGPGDANLKRYVGNDPVNNTDPTGLDAKGGSVPLQNSDYILGTSPPWDAEPLTMPNWGVDAYLMNPAQNPFSADLYQKNVAAIVKRALETLGGGLAGGKPHAADNLSHYLSNSGTPKTFAFAEMNQKSPGAYTALVEEANKAIYFAEKFAKPEKTVNIVSGGEKSHNVWGGDWEYAVGRYRVWGSGKVTCAGGKFHMDWEYNMRDNYEFENSTELRAGLVLDSEMYSLYRFGVARPYRLAGEQKFHFDWKKGEQVGKEIPLPFPRP